MRRWKKAVSVLLSLAMLLGLCAVSAGAVEPNVSVNSAEGLKNALNDPLVTEITLTADITMTENWMPAVITAERTLVIDGGGYTISGLTTIVGNETPSSSTPGSGGSCYYCSGLIGSNVGNLTIEDLTFDSANISITNEGVADAGASSLAVVVGRNSGTLTLDHVDVNNSTVTGFTKIGALVGQQAGTVTVSKCAVSDFTGHVTVAEGEVGGCNGAVFGYVSAANSNTVNGVKVDGVTWEMASQDGYDEYVEVGDCKYGKSGDYWYNIHCNTWPIRQNKIGGNQQYVEVSNGVFTREPHAVFAASIDGYAYPSFAAAVAAAQSGETVKLLTNVTLTGMITLDKSITLDLNGHTLSHTTGNSIVQVIDEAVLTINGTTAGSAVYGRINLGIADNNNGSAILNGGSYSCAEAQTVLHINGTCMSSNVTISGATINSPSDNGIQLNGKGTFLIENSSITGATGVYIKAGTLTVRNSNITGNMSPANYSYNGNGANATGDAVVVDACNYPGGNPAIHIVSGAFSGTKSAIGYYQYPAGPGAGTATISVSGGTFSTNPTAYLASGYALSQIGSSYTVYLPSDDGGSGGGGSAPAVTPTVTETVTDAGTDTTTTTTTVTPATSGTTATATITEKAVTDTVTAAVEAAKEADTAPVVEIKVDAKENATEVKTNLPVKALDTVAHSGASLTVSTPVASVSMPAAVVEAIADKAGSGTVTLSVETVKPEALTAAQQEAVGDTAGAVILDLNLTAGGTKVSELGGEVEISVPYTPAANEDMSKKVVWFIADDGSITACEGSFDAATKTFVFKTSHFSTYVLANFPLADVAPAYWAYSQIAWAYNNSYMNGKTADAFVPMGTVNRQQLWMVLARLSGAAPADMAAAKDWAVANGVSDGSDPTGAVSRQQMATMLHRYAALKAYAVTGSADLTAYPDSASVTAYAADAMTWAVAGGVIGGTTDGRLNPAGSTTRAQFAVMLNRFVTNVVK